MISVGQSTSERDLYDAVIVGSGAGGGMAAYTLTRRGLRVLLLEAGRDYVPATETPMYRIEADAPLNGAPTPDKEGGFYDAIVGGGTEIPGEPYTVGEGTPFKWFRSRMLGGRTNHWGRCTLRFGPYDFRNYTRFGVGVDWPIAYEDLAPYYDRVEKLIGVFGAAEGIENSPDSPAGILQPPPPLRPLELWTQMALEKKMGIPVVADHAAILTQPLNGRPPCLYATPCRRGWSIRANFQTPTVLLPPALATGRLHIRSLAMAYEVAVDKRGRAGGVRYVDKSTGARHLVRSRAVVLAASACETARILLNSKSALFPNGLANSSGHVGRNLTTTPDVGVIGEIPALQGLPQYNDDGAWIPHAYLPWWGHGQQKSGRVSFATEYQVWPVGPSGSGARSMPSVSDFVSLPYESNKPLYGQRLRDRLRHDYGSKLTLVGSGGMIPNADCRCDIDPRVKDRWGIPVLRFHWKWGENELQQVKHALATLSEMISALGGRKLTAWASTEGNVRTFHELGTARMGSSPADSVLNAFGQTWDVRNLYVADGASFAGHACKNPTETLLALSWRASDHLADSFIRKEIA